MSEAALAQGPQDYFRLLGTILDRKFQIERLVAEGGFGVLYYGTHLTLHKPIAIKVLKVPAEFNEAARATFIDKFALEARTIARLDHPNIVQVLDFGVSPVPSGELAPWMVLEWLTGQTLEGLLHARRPQGFSPHESMAMIRPVIEALAYAHDEGIAHRDIKPANVMVIETKRGPVLKLLDFGIAKVMDEDEKAGTGHTRTRTVMSAFSPAYAAPEQLSGTRTGPWTDVHALALIITEMMTGRPPYDGDEPTQLFSEVLSPQRPTPAKRLVDAGPWEFVLARALAIKPDERIKNAGEFLNQLESAQPIGFRGATGQFPAVGTGPNPVVPSGHNNISGVNNVVPPGGKQPEKSGSGRVVLWLVLLGALVGGGLYFRNWYVARSLAQKVVPPIVPPSVTVDVHVPAIAVVDAGTPVAINVAIPVVDAGSPSLPIVANAADSSVAPAVNTIADAGTTAAATQMDAGIADASDAMAATQTGPGPNGNVANGTTTPVAPQITTPDAGSPTGRSTPGQRRIGPRTTPRTHTVKPPTGGDPPIVIQ